jgi:uncharacterized protein (TIRG00374 family)
VPTEVDSASLIARFRSWFAWAVAVGALVYVGVSVWAGFADVGDALRSFDWIWFAVAIALTVIGNYALRFAKWHWLLGRLGVEISLADDALIFIAGLAMVISPAKAGELLKPYLVRERTGVPMATTIPALVTERLTDGIAALIIAAVSVSRYASDKADIVYGTIAVSVAGVAVLMNDRLSLGILRAVGRLPVMHRMAEKLEEMYRAMRLCLAPWPFFVTLVVSMVAWFAECWGYQLLWTGMNRDVGLEVASFLYAFATVLGGVAPGGLGVADGALVAGAQRLLGLPEGEVVAAALLIRTATLWTGVLLGAIALLFVGRVLKRQKT